MYIQLLWKSEAVIKKAKQLRCWVLEVFRQDYTAEWSFLAWMAWMSLEKQSGTHSSSCSCCCLSARSSFFSLTSVLSSPQSFQSEVASGEQQLPPYINLMMLIRMASLSMKNILCRCCDTFSITSWLNFYIQILSAKIEIQHGGQVWF